MTRFPAGFVNTTLSSLILSWLAWAPALAAVPDPLADVIDAAEEIMQTLVKEEELVGAGFTLFFNGKLASRAYGSVTTDGSVPFTTDTPTALHELAQPLTALAVMQLVEQGEVELDQPLQQWYPAFNPWQEAAVAPQITLRQLLSHHSGLPAYYAPGSGRADHTVDPDSLAWRSLVDNSSTMAYVTDPGRVYEYSYLGYSLLGAVVEKASGLDYGQYVGARILQPLEMDDTYLVVDPDEVMGVSPAFVDGRQAPHRKFRDVPAAGLVSSLEDMGRFMQGMLTDDSLLSAGLKQQMFAVQNAMIAEDGNFEIGLGYFISPVTGGTFLNGETASHASTDGIARAYMLLHPGMGFGVLLASNTRVSSVRLRDSADRIMEHMLTQEPGYRSQPWQAHADSPLTDSGTDGITGTYSGPGGLFTIATSRRGLQLDVPYLPFLGVELLPREADYFGVDIRLLGFLNLGRFSQVRLLSESIEGKVTVIEGRKLIHWYWRGITAVSLTELPDDTAPAALARWQQKTGTYRAESNDAEYSLEYDREHQVFTLGRDTGGFRLFREPPDIYCARSPTVLETCGRGLVGNGTRNLLRILEDGTLLSAYGELLIPGR
jgi:CubicO group peptidase (beta-lactamase class C family)